MERVKIVIYKRVSTKGQGESGLGLEAQDAYIQHFVTSNPKFEVVREFTEVASAKSVDCKKRPQLCEAVAMCAKSGFTLVVAKVDRLSRTTEHALEIFSKLDGRLISCDIPNLDKFTLTLYMAIADRERELISLRTKQALQAKKARTGTIKQTEKGAENLSRTNAQEKAVKATIEKAKDNENNQRAIDTAKMLRDKGMTLEAIAEYLNARKFRTSQGKAFQKTTVKRLIEK
ncbi:MAG: recombinase family protein [Saprospiraceae bacterium]|nr:recombinase family protein [Saprospiraceae bacterium]